MEPKFWWQSRTIWFNIAMILVAGASEAGPILDLADPATADALRPYLMMIAGLGNVVLRVLTDRPVK